MIKKIAISFLSLLLLILAFAAISSPDYLISRELKISAKPEVVFPWLNSAKKSNEWMPWAEIDPKVQMTFSGPDEGLGSAASWVSEGQMGVGSSTISEVVPNQSVKTTLEYKSPFEMVQTAEMSVMPDGEGSLVKWSVAGKNNFIGRVFSLFINMDKMVGPNFEKGLQNLKSKIETGP